MDDEENVSFAAIVEFPPEWGEHHRIAFEWIRRTVVPIEFDDRRVALWDDDDVMHFLICWDDIFDIEEMVEVDQMGLTTVYVVF